MHPRTGPNDLFPFQAHVVRRLLRRVFGSAEDEYGTVKARHGLDQGLNLLGL